jgi:hypothetical protein
MKTEPRDPLLAMVLDDEEVFRSVILRQTLALARRRRRVRLARSMLTTSAVFVFAIGLLYRSARLAPVASPAVASVTSVRIIHSTPFSGNNCVRTCDNLFTPVKSASGGLSVVHSRSEGVALIDTKTGAPAFDLLDDRQLLSAFSPERAAIIAAGTKEARLVFF